MNDRKEIAGTISGVALAVAVAAVGYVAARIPAVAALRFSPLVIAIILGMLVGNFGARFFPASMHRGIAFSQKRILRFAIIFYGFRVTFQEIAGVGVAGLVADIIMLSTTFILGTWAGRRFFGLDRDTAVLCAAGSSICGAAAVLATEPVVEAAPYKVTVAVGTVIVFGTIAMFLYPLIYRIAGMGPLAFGIYTGSTVHEVAHVVAVGGAVGHGVGATAVIVKLTRVMLLAPFLVILSAVLARQETSRRRTGAEAGQPAAAIAVAANEPVAVSATAAGGERGLSGPPAADEPRRTGDPVDRQVGRRAAISIPWFAVLFVAVAGFHSLKLLPSGLVSGINVVDTFLLATAMAALGIDSRVERFRGVGAGPVLLGLTMFAWLVAGGYLVNRLVDLLIR